MREKDLLFEYRKKLPHAPHGRGEQESNIVDAAQEFVLQYISYDELKEIFGGFIATFDKAKDSEKQRYIGVWGKDKTGAFKRIMEERGAKFEIRKIDGETRRISTTIQTGKE